MLQSLPLISTVHEARLTLAEWCLMDLKYGGNKSLLPMIVRKDAEGLFPSSKKWEGRDAYRIGRDLFYKGSQILQEKGVPKWRKEVNGRLGVSNEAGKRETVDRFREKSGEMLPLVQVLFCLSSKELHIKCSSSPLFTTSTLWGRVGCNTVITSALFTVGLMTEWEI